MMKFFALAGAWLASIISSIGSETQVYKTADGQSLKLLIDKPAEWKVTDKRPVIVFFFGGGWVGGRVEQFERHCAYLASRGIIGIRADYRVIPKGDKGPPVMCVMDAKSAMRYVYSHAPELGIDKDRLAAGGGSAGGHLAAFTTLVDGLDDPQDDLKSSCKAKALVLFNPVLDNGPGQWGNTRLGSRYLEFSPAHHVVPGAPPTVIFLGDSDKLIPVSVMNGFGAKMKDAGSRCDIHIYPGAGHGFFNNGEFYRKTMIETDRFLSSLGWIKGERTLDPVK